MIWSNSNSVIMIYNMEKQALHKTALDSMAIILYYISFTIFWNQFKYIVIYNMEKHALHKTALDRRAMFFVHISYIDNDHQNQNEPLLSFIMYFTMSWHCHHDIQYFPLTLLPHSFIIQNTISESDSKSLRQDGEQIWTIFCYL